MVFAFNVNPLRSSPGQSHKKQLPFIPTLNLSPQVSIEGLVDLGGLCRRSVFTRPCEAPQKSLFGNLENYEHLFFISAQNDDMLPLWINYRKLSISLPSRCPPPIPAFTTGL